MPQSIIDQVNQIGKEKHDIKGISLSNQTTNILEDEMNGLKFNLGQKFDTKMDKYALADFPGVDIESTMQLGFMPTHQEKTPKFAVESDLDDLMAE